MEMKPILGFKTVDFFKAQVKYSGRFEDYTKAELFELAKARNTNVDCFDHERRMFDTDAELIDGTVEVEDLYPCNKIAEVRWAYIRQEDQDV